MPVTALAHIPDTVAPQVACNAAQRAHTMPIRPGGTRCKQCPEAADRVGAPAPRPPAAALAVRVAGLAGIIGGASGGPAARGAMWAVAAPGEQRMATVTSYTVHICDRTRKWVAERTSTRRASTVGQGAWARGGTRRLVRNLGRHAPLASHTQRTVRTYRAEQTG